MMLGLQIQAWRPDLVDQACSSRSQVIHDYREDLASREARGREIGI